MDISVDKLFIGESSMLRSIIPLKSIILIMVGVLLIVFYFSKYVSKVSELSPELHKITQSIASEVAKELPTEEIPVPLVVLPFKGDYTRTLRNDLVQAISVKGAYPVIKFGWAGSKLQAMGLDVPIISDAQSAKTWGSYLGGKRILWGEIHSLKSNDGHGEANITVILYDDDGTALWTQRFPYAESKALQQHNSDSAHAHQWGMVMIWLLSALALPFILWPLTVSFIRREQNIMGALLLLILTSMSTGLAYFFGYWVDFWYSYGQIALWLSPVALFSLWGYYLILEQVAKNME